MKFFSWMQNKFNGAQSSSRNNSNHHQIPVPPTNHRKNETRNEEFHDWPNSLLAIGTLGNTNNNKNQTENRQEATDNHQNEIVQEHDDQEQCSSPDLTEFTPEEVGKMQKALTKLLSSRKSTSKSESQANSDLPLDRFLNCPSSLEVDRRLSNTSTVNSGSFNCENEDEIERTIRAIIGKCRDVCEKKKQQKEIGKKSVAFLVKKMFACRSGFAPAPSLRDTFQESRMEKLLRTILSKKIYPQNSSRAPSRKRYLEDKTTSTAEDDNNDEKRREKTCHSGKWDKTDSEYIVLEI